MHHACDFVVDSLPDRKPVQLVQHMRDMITLSGTSDDPCGSILDQLNLPHEAIRHKLAIKLHLHSQ